ncbi:TlpA family protein disulfide reductase [Halarcobacter ebronensis]|uniref:Thioredoxin n=1 Tax=Halarcobacter ebronensis TaxID=1462615 RepID=A0A4Q1AKT7_9BACT|nr:TlpA disulfide reductase family protein [Halarcobacter ebronensis]QKF81602.1 protein disulfide reductase, TlpA family [Halarcobacter ebronensis]RXK05530.1 thioredoxin [Halarcobacter ebronensis]
MKKFLLLFTVLVAFIFVGCGSEDEAKAVVDNSQSFKELKALSNKDYTLKTTQGKEIKLTIQNDILTSKDYNGQKIVMVNFWATWCPPCIKEIPVFNELYEKYSDKFEIIGVLFEKDKDPNELKAFIEKYNIKFPITVGDENFRMAKAFNNVQKVPESYLYSKGGNFVKSYIGEVNKEDLEEYIRSN